MRFLIATDIIYQLEEPKMMNGPNNTTATQHQSTSAPLLIIRVNLRPTLPSVPKETGDVGLRE